MTNTTSPGNDRASKGLDIGLWVAQGLLAMIFIGGGIWKMVTPVEELAETFTWTGEVSPFLLYATSTFDILGGLGVLLPAVTRIRPGLTSLAALGCVALQLSAIVFHISRGEAADIPFNILMLGLATFIFWGRHWKVPIRPRW